MKMLGSFKMCADGRVTKAYPPTAPRKLRERVGSRAITDLSAHTFGMQMCDSTLGGRPAKESSEPEPVKLPKELEVFRGTGFSKPDQVLQDKVHGMLKHVKQTRKPKKNGFFDLPQELKDMIYKEVFNDTVLICTWSTKTGIPSYTQELELTPLHVPEDYSEGTKNVYDESDVDDSDADSVMIDDTWARDLEFHLYDDGTARHRRMQRQIEEEYLEHCISSYRGSFAGAEFLIASRKIYTNASIYFYSHCTFRFSSRQLSRLDDTPKLFNRLRYVEIEDRVNRRYVDISAICSNLLAGKRMRKITIGSNVSQRWLGELLDSFDDYETDDKHQREFTGRNGVLTRFWDDLGSLTRLTVPGNRKISFVNFAKLGRYKMPPVWKQLRLVEDAF